MNYLLDTNILLIYIRDEATRGHIERFYNPFSAQNNPIISVVTVGEIKSIARQNQWGEKKMNLLVDILNDLIVADIHSEDVIEMYAEIDAYSQGKLKGKPLPTTSRNMGKNDLWIAASAVELDAELITFDRHFLRIEDEALKIWSELT